MFWYSQKTIKTNMYKLKLLTSILFATVSASLLVFAGTTNQTAFLKAFPEVVGFSEYEKPRGYPIKWKGAGPRISALYDQRIETGENLDMKFVKTIFNENEN